MIILIYTGEDVTSELVQNVVCEKFGSTVLKEDESVKDDFLINKKGVMILSNLSEWNHYKKFTTILLVVFPEKPTSQFYQDIVNLNKFSYKIRYLNGLENIQEQVNNLNLNSRPSWKQYFMDLAVIASYRSSCKKRNVGALIVKDRRIISTGFNGTPVGTVNCIDGGCIRCNSDSKIGEGLDLCFCLHAEESAILGQPKELTTGATMYISLFPCGLCIKKIIQARIKKIIFKEFYCKNDEKLLKIFEAANIKVKRFEPGKKKNKF
ncbi:Deoxycytidylate deaminase [Pseudoloma neurophilia]|uniref:dCMP deaminase n=1 Tax=Pseudoloma neurophilia TaxID=146866 RepID=A0A0R0LVJ3_9MICR|nr:Deoxycytidylate deaminase [Pseudoloma neurophilia]